MTFAIRVGVDHDFQPNEVRERRAESRELGAESAGRRESCKRERWGQRG
jgi:hypothetical protein